MYGRSICKNNRAVTAPLEFTIASGIVLIGIVFLFVASNSMFVPYDTSDVDLRSKAMIISNSLISNPGDPVNWEEGDIANLQRLGFSSQTDSYGVLDINKIDLISSFNGLSDDHYTEIKESIGLVNNQYAIYDFNITITVIDAEESLLEYGKSYEDANVARSYARDVVVGYDDATLTVVIFR